MPHISKAELSKEQYRDLLAQLVRVVDSTGTRKMKNQFFWDFLTHTERVMLCKRLAIIAMLIRGDSHYEIWTQLGVSSSTVARIAKIIDRGGYGTTVSILRKKDLGVLDVIDKIMRGGGIMPPYVGKRRIRDFGSER
jgi:uncharacterized protein YerC